MKSLIASLVASFVVVAAIGCSGGETADTTANGTSESAAGTSATGTTVAEKANCAACGAEYALADLKDHDGGKWCAKCLEAHSH